MTKRGQKHMTKIQREELVAKALAGEKAPVLAETFKVTVGQVFKIVRQERPALSAGRRGARGVEQSKRSALRRVDAGEAVAAVAREIGVDRGTIFRWMRARAP
jgi:transposase-like protein